MIEDVVRQLGYLTLGTRLKRLGERLQAHTQRVLEAEGLQIPAGQFPVLAALERLGPLTVGEVAEAVGIAQPGATRALAQLAAARLVTLTSGRVDQRRRTARLTPAGKRLVARGRRLAWPQIEAAVRELCDGHTGPLLDQLAAIEDGLAAAPLDRRVAARPRGRR